MQLHEGIRVHAHTLPPFSAGPHVSACACRLSDSQEDPFKSRPRVWLRLELSAAEMCFVRTGQLAEVVRHEKALKWEGWGALGYRMFARY